MRDLLRTQMGRAFAATAALVAVAAAIAMAALWPGDVAPRLGQLYDPDTERAEVLEISEFACPTVPGAVCKNATIELKSGPHQGEETTIKGLGGTGGPVPPGLSVGDDVRVSKVAAVPGVAAPGELEYTLTDYERRAPMIWLALAFAALVVIFGRLRGALSLLGLGVSLAIILVFVVPAILDGTAPLTVAVVGGMAIMVATISLAHGINAKSLAAILGTTASLALVALLAKLFTDLTSLTGLSSEEASILATNEVVPQASLQGLILAGMVIGALGVLDDVTVSQSSTVIALRRANPDLGFGELYRSAIEVGRDHVSATVNTLVLAYAGAALPVLLILTSNDIGLSDGINFEIVAKEVVAMLVGSIGLIAAVPLTTALAGLLAVRSTPELLGDEEHTHAH